MGPNQNNSNTLPNQFTRGILKRVLNLEKKIDDTVPGVTHLKEVASDSFNGTRLAPINTSLTGYLINKSHAGRVGYEAINGSTNSGAFVGFIARTNPATLYQDYLYTGMLGTNHYSGWGANGAVIWAYRNLSFVAANSGYYDFRVGVNDGQLNTFLTAFKIKNSGEVTAPLLTTTIINADTTGKVIITKEHLENHWRAKVSLTANQINNIGTTPIDAIAAPGAGKMIIITKTWAQLSWGSVAFDDNSININTDGASAGWIIDDGILIQTADSNARGGEFQNLNMFSENTKIIITGTDSIATGDSTIDVYITYEIITL